MVNSVPNLLHVDASIRRSGSTSRILSAAFAEEWKRHHPGGGYRYRDLAVDPVPHLTHAVREYLLNPSEEHPDLSDESRAATDQVIADVHWATIILLGTPMYNYSVPSTVKAWLDLFVLPSCIVELAGDAAPLKGKSLVTVTARGNTYSAGTGKEPLDMQEPYIRAIFAAIGIEDVYFVHAELTAAKEVAFLADYRAMAHQSMAVALAEAKRLASL
jgi:FMN-dependent NADH-azoreductase